MVLCSVDYVKSKISFSTLTDGDISNIIAEVTDEVLTICETTDETNPLVIQAGKYSVLADVLRRLKTTGEMAASVKAGNGQRQNTTDNDIELYEKKADRLIVEYKAARSYVFSSPSFSAGFSNHHGGHNGSP